MTYQYLSDISVPLALCKGVIDIDHEVARWYIDTFYCNIVDALSCAAADNVPLAKASFFKFWWDEECQALKDESVSKHRTWVALVRPREGPAANAMRKARCEYKLLLKRKRYQEQSCFSNELDDALEDTDFTSFWKSWNAKFGHTTTSQVINGLSDHGSIAEVYHGLLYY